MTREENFGGAVALRAVCPSSRTYTVLAKNFGGVLHPTWRHKAR